MQNAHVRVVCRFRPVNERERKEGAKFNPKLPHVTYEGGNTLALRNNSTTSSKQQLRTYAFDKVYWDTDTTQVDVYEGSARFVVEDVLRGYNGTIFAYGQTGAGKTFTMFGPSIKDEDLMGIIPRACWDIFDHIANDESGTTYTIKCSFLEIYKEVIRDLLDQKKLNLKIRDSPDHGVWVQDLTEEFVSTPDDVFYLLKSGEKNRRTAKTKMNNSSSRSHSLFIMTITQKTADGTTTTGRLNLADLAGSEKVNKTGAEGETLEEAKKINQSLAALGNCINALSSASQKAKGRTGSDHVPYRESKLTHVLKESLGGNSKTTLLINCSKHQWNMEETISTLNFGKRAKFVKNQVRVNMERSVKELNAIINKLTRDYRGLKRYASRLERDLLALNPGYDIATAKKETIGVGRRPKGHVRSVSTGGNKTPRKQMIPKRKALTPNPKSTQPKQNGTKKPPRRRASISSTVPNGKDLPDEDYNPMELAETKLALEKLTESTRNEITDLTNKLTKATEGEKSVRETLKKLQPDYKRVKEEAQRLVEELAEQLQVKESLESKMDYEVSQRKVEVQQAKGELEKMTIANKKLEKQIADIKAQKQEIQEQEAARKLEAAEIEGTTKELEAELVRAKGQLVLKEELESKLLGLKAELEKQLSLADEDLKAASAENESLNDKLAELEKQVRGHAFDMKLLQQEKDNFEKEATGLKEKLAHMESLLQSETEESERSALLKDELTNREEELSNLQHQVNDLKTEQLKLQNQLEENEAEKKVILERVEREREKQAGEAEEAKKKLDTELEEARAELDELGDEKEQIVLELEHVEEQYIEEQLKLEEAKKRIAELEEQFSASAEKEKEWEEMFEEVTNAHEQDKELLASSQARIKALEKNVDDLHNNNEDLKNKLNGAVEAFVNMQTKMTEEMMNLEVQLRKQRLGNNRRNRARGRRGRSNIVKPISGGRRGARPRRRSVAQRKAREAKEKEDKEEDEGFWSFFKFKSTSEDVSNTQMFPSHDELSKENTKEGSLSQQQGVFSKQWKEKWFVLKGQSLYYFNSKTSDVADGAIKVSNCSIAVKQHEDPEAVRKHKWIFTLVHDTRKPTVLCAHTLEEMGAWISAIGESAQLTMTRSVESDDSRTEEPKTEA